MYLPVYISDLLQPTNQSLLLVPRTHFKTRGNRSFTMMAGYGMQCLHFSVFLTVFMLLNSNLRHICLDWLLMILCYFDFFLFLCFFLPCSINIFVKHFVVFILQRVLNRSDLITYVLTLQRKEKSNHCINIFMLCIWIKCPFLQVHILIFWEICFL